MAATFGLDFGTTNSVVAFVGPDPATQKAMPKVLTESGRPHPSVVWYSGPKPVVGRRAKDQLNELGLGVFGEIVRSPKIFLGSESGIHVGGVTRQAVDVVGDVLRFLRDDALSPQRGLAGNPFEVAVITIPVSMRGPARAELRQAAQKAGIRIHQFVHEPLAALYGYLRGQSDFRQAVAALERRLVLVFDWGGGTLDLTLCRVQDGVLTQIVNLGDPEVGGDRFDDRLRQLVRDKHESQHPTADWLRVQPTAEARLIQACEDAKIALSTRHTSTMYVRDVLSVPGSAKDLRVEVSRLELEGAVRDLVAKGLGRIDDILTMLQLSKGAVEFCLATGGMVSMPAIQQGLREIFGLNRLRLVENSATLVSEGAAWIAHDGAGLQLAKPIEVLHADDCYVSVIPSGTPLPFDGKVVQTRIDMYCVDPSDGFAKFLFARPKWPSRESHGDPRNPYALLTLPVDHYSKPLMERLHLDVSIDHDLIARIQARSGMRDDVREVFIHDLEFGLSVDAGVVTPGPSRQNRKEAMA